MNEVTLKPYSGVPHKIKEHDEDDLHDYRKQNEALRKLMKERVQLIRGIKLKDFKHRKKYTAHQEKINSGLV